MFIGPATSALIVLGFTLLVLFVARFARTTWRRSVMGRQVMLSNGAFMIIMGLAVVTAFVGPDWPGRDALRLGCWAAIDWIFWRQLVLLTRAQRGAGGAPAGEGKLIMKFSREPAAYIAALGALLAVLVAFKLPGVSADQATAIVAAVTAATGLATAWRTRPVAPSLVTYLGTAAFQLLAAYGLRYTPEQVSTANVALVAFLVLLRGAITPAVDPAPTAPDSGPVR